MTDRFVTRGFIGRRSASGQPAAGGDARSRTPSGQYLTTDLPVLSAGPAPRTPLDRWSFSIEGLVREPVRWSWDACLPARGVEGILANRMLAEHRFPEIASRIAEGEIRIPALQTFSFEDVDAALEMQATRHVKGKLAIAMG